MHQKLLLPSELYCKDTDFKITFVIPNAFFFCQLLTGCSFLLLEIILDFYFWQCFEIFMYIIYSFNTFSSFLFLTLV